MSAEKHEIDRIINEIICTGNYWANKFGLNGSNIGGFVAGIEGGRFTPLSWPKFDENWMSNEFYIGALKTNHLHEWLEHLFNLKRREPEPDMFSIAAPTESEIFLGSTDIYYSLWELAQEAWKRYEKRRVNSITIGVYCFSDAGKRKLKICEDPDGSDNIIFDWVE